MEADVDACPATLQDPDGDTEMILPTAPDVDAPASSQSARGNPRRAYKRARAKTWNVSHQPTGVRAPRCVVCHSLIEAGHLRAQSSTDVRTGGRYCHVPCLSKMWLKEDTMTVADNEPNPSDLEVQLPNIHHALSSEVAQPEIIQSPSASPNPTQTLYKSLEWWKDANVKSLLTANIPLNQTIPNRLVSAFQAIVRFTLDLIHSDEDPSFHEIGWKLFMSLPKLLLHTTASGTSGRAGQRQQQIGRMIALRLNQFGEGHGMISGGTHLTIL